MNDQENLHQEFEKHQEFIRSLPLEDLLDRLVKAHDSTDVILEGYNLVTTVNEGHGIALAGIIRLREALAESGRQTQLEKQAANAENLNKTLANVPMGLYIF